MLLHFGARHLGFLGGRHTLASLLPGMDVHCHDRIEPSPEPVGALHWNLCRGIVGLREYFHTTFFFNGLQQLYQWIHTGHLERPDLIIAVPACCANLIVIIGCVWAYTRLPMKSPGDAGRLLVTFALTTAFLALDMALFQPRYLGIFPRMLHPHLP
jgi:hypothetical protein